MTASKLDRIRAVCTADPSNAFAFYTLAMELKKTDVAAALPVFQDVRTRFPTYVANYYHYGLALEASGDIEAAIKMLREGMEVARKAGDDHAYSELEAKAESLA